ncbi:MAG: sulfatase, partial [Candidatus Hydrogenedentales bacterium]
MTFPSNRAPVQARKIADPAFVAIVTLLLVSCGGKVPLDRDRPNVIVLVVDSLRADHLGAYGYNASATPRMDEFARTATVYEHAAATSPSCLPSHASMLTGKLPYAHAAHRHLTNEGDLIEMPLADHHVTLAEMLRELGYDTGAFLANQAALAAANIDQGFMRFDVRRETAAAKNRRIRGWVADRNRPFFLFVNYMDAHRPFQVRRTGWRFYQDVDTERPWQAFADAVANGPSSHAAMLAGEVVGHYDAAIANVDRSVGELLDWLKSEGLYENTIIVLTSDHGQAFGEHDYVGHGYALYEGELHVPLMVKYPGQRVGGSQSGLISTLYLPRLVLDEIPEAAEDNVRRTFEAVSADAFTFAENYYPPEGAHSQAAEGVQRVSAAAYDWPFNLVAGADTHRELYDLREDPR